MCYDSFSAAKVAKKLENDYLCTHEMVLLDTSHGGVHQLHHHSQRPRQHDGERSNILRRAW